MTYTDFKSNGFESFFLRVNINENFKKRAVRFEKLKKIIPVGKYARFSVRFSKNPRATLGNFRLFIPGPPVRIIITYRDSSVGRRNNNYCCCCTEVSAAVRVSRGARRKRTMAAKGARAFSLVITIIVIIAGNNGIRPAVSRRLIIIAVNTYTTIQYTANRTRRYNARIVVVMRCIQQRGRTLSAENNNNDGNDDIIIMKIFN